MGDHMCRFCAEPLIETVIDLGLSPLSNAFLKEDQLNKPETYYPLQPKFCRACFLVQLPEFASPQDIFTDYVYFSSYSESWLKHCKHYSEMMIKRFALARNHYVIEIASNDGYLLQYFNKKDIPVLGIEPAENVAQVARTKGIHTRSDFFGTKLAQELVERKPDLIIANNVLAHVPNLNDFVAGLKILLSANGIITVEFPHLLNLIQENQFDTIYHEHFSYFSLLTLTQVFRKHQLKIFDVEKISVHGGSLRVFVTHEENELYEPNKNITNVIKKEQNHGLNKLQTYKNFADKIHQVKEEVVNFLHAMKNSGKRVIGYGAPAKGNTLLNYFGIDKTLIPFTVDKSPHKQGKYLPGSHIPVLHPDAIKSHKPDYVFILPWNLQDEIVEQISYVKSWAGKFIVPIPKLCVL